MKWTFLLLLITCLLSACTDPPVVKSASPPQQSAPKNQQIDPNCQPSDSLLRLTKWMIYSTGCGVHLVSNIDGTPLPITKGEMPLVLDTIICKHDTTVVLFVSVYKGVQTDTNLYANGWAGGLGFIKGASVPFYFTAEVDIGEGLFFSSKRDLNRYCLIREKQAVAFLESHKTTADPWFLAEAQRRGLIK